MKVLMIVANKTQRAEFITSYDVLLRAGLEVTVLGKTEILKNDPSSFVGQELNDDVSFNEYEAVIFPGGRGGVEELKNRFIDYENSKPSILGNKLIEFYHSNKLIAAICAAPSLLGELGLLKNKNFTCYPGFEGNHFGGNYLGEEVVNDHNIITGRSMYYSADFGLEIVKYLLGNNEKIRVEKQIKGIL